jgi:hypothetical protein
MMNHHASDINIRSKRLAVLILLSFLFLVFASGPLKAETKFTLLLTSNLQGRFSLERENQDESDPMLLLAQSIIKEKERSRFDVYLDLGNAFYPGALSRYSYGSIMMDFFDYFNCEATLISSRDISIGFSNLEFLAKGRTTKMLSANIARDKQPVFIPSTVLKHSGKKIGIIGVSSSDGLIDIADRNILNISFSEYRESIKVIAAQLKKEGCDNLILLSGLNYRNNLELMQNIPEVNLAVCGGDSTGSLFSFPSARVDLQWGRSIVTLLQNDGYYMLELNLGEGVNVSSMNFIKPEKYETPDPAYAEFSQRLSIWKQKFKEEDHLVAENVPASFITDETAANMLRHRNRSEIGIIERYSIFSQMISGSLYYSTILSLVNDDYPVFTYRLSGAELKKIQENNGKLVITGIEKGRVQNYPVEDKRTYSVSSTQLAYDTITRILRKHTEYSNTWSTLQDEIENDLKTEKSLISPDFNYLDERFRILLDITLSGLYDKSKIEKDESIETPPGKPEESYLRWGMEGTANITIYNRNHQLILTPYIYYIKQDEEYLQNLLRGTLLYNYNLTDYVRPYHKSQLDSVVVEIEVEDEDGNMDKGRPVLARETIGLSLKTDRVTGKLGGGFEKQLQDPEMPRIDGIEALLDVNIPLTDTLIYTFKLDSFVSLKTRTSDKLEARSEITNALSFKINSMFGVSMKYKWFKLYSSELKESYKYEQTLLSVDLKTDFKLF